ncbi:MAG: hypothetical protein ACYTG1_09235 [Planctomycetota bacterium]|jgi:hypothetical protein
MTPTPRPADLDRALRAAGAEPAPGGWRTGELRLAADRDWLTARVRTSRRAIEVGPPILEPPGLWKEAERAGRVDRVFDLPLATLAGGDDEPVEPGRLVAWMEATLRGETPPTAADAIAEIERRCDDGAGVLRAGGVVRRPRVVAADGRLAVRAELASLPARMSGARRRHLRRLLRDVAAVRMVRAGCAAAAAGAGSAVVLDVDLTGLPEGAAGVVVGAALPILRWCFAWLAAPIALLTDPEAPAAVLEL